MKKTLQFLTLPFIQLIVFIYGYVTLFILSNDVMLCFASVFSLIVYIFLGGYLFSRIENKKVRIASAIITSVLLILIYSALMAAQYFFDTDLTFFALIISPISMNIASFIDGFAGLELYVLYGICTVFTPIPVLITIISAKVFIAKNKVFKAISIILLCLICIGAAIPSVITADGVSEYSYLGDDGQLYNAFYDVNGIKYEDNTDVPYYDENGSVYHWTYDESIDTELEENFLYCGELTDSNGNTYDLHKVYVNADGYIFIDENDEIDIRDDIPSDVDTDWLYCDSDGNIYASILSINYFSDGTPFTACGDEYRTK